MEKYLKRFVPFCAVLCFLCINIINANAGTPLVPVITNQPINVTFTAPARATFKVIASGHSNNYQWMQSVNDGQYAKVS